jgi:teichuronic acid biosynthesis protein TuaE
MPLSTVNSYNKSLQELGLLCLYLCVATTFLGSAFLSVEVGSIHLYPSRFFLSLLWLLFFISAALTGTLLTRSQLAVKNYFLVFALWLVYSGSYVLLVQDYIAYVRYSLFLLMGLSIVFFVTVYATGPEALNRIFQIWLLMFVFLVCLGLWENLTGHHLEVSRRSLADGPKLRFVPTGTYTITNRYASSLALGFPLLLSLMTTARKKWLILLAIGLMFLTVYIVSETHSRLCLFAILLELAVAFCFFFSRRIKLLFLSACCLGLIGLAALVPSAFLQQYDLVKDHFASAVRQIEDQRASGKIRVNLFLNGLYFFRDSGGLGLGAGNFNSYMEERPYFPTSSKSHPENVVFPHNWWMELLTEYGLLIFCLYVLTFVFLFSRVVQTYRAAVDPVSRRIGQFLITALAGFLIVCMAPGYFIAFMPQWLLIGMSLAYIASFRTMQVHS